MATAEEQEAMVGLFEDKIMEMLRRRVSISLSKTVQDGKVLVSVHLNDLGRDGTPRPFMMMSTQISIEVEQAWVQTVPGNVKPKLR